MRVGPLNHPGRQARAALNANPGRAMRSDLGIDGEGCGGRGAQAHPASADTVTAFVDAMAKARAPATVRRCVASVAAAHRAMAWGKTARYEPARRALEPANGAGVAGHACAGRRQRDSACLSVSATQSGVDVRTHTHSVRINTLHVNAGHALPNGRRRAQTRGLTPALRGSVTEAADAAANRTRTPSSSASGRHL